MDPDRYQMVDLKRRLTKLEKAYDRSLARTDRLVEKVEKLRNRSLATDAIVDHLAVENLVGATRTEEEE